MILSYFTVNFIPCMILLALLALIYVNKDVKIPATNLFLGCILVAFLLTVISFINADVDVTGFSPEKTAQTLRVHTLLSTLSYALRPCVILLQLLIILPRKKYKLLCIVPAVINAAIYSTALFGYRIAFYIDETNRWHSGPLRLTVFLTQFLYLMILLYSTVHSFSTGDRKKSSILIVMFLQAVFAAILEYEGLAETSTTDSITILCIFEYYIYLSTVYRQELNQKLSDYIEKIEESGIRMKRMSREVTEALANAIDAKDEYTHGHSSRVAAYSRKLAEMNGKSEDECDEIFYAALLHDVGKIGISESIITKDGKLTQEEYEEIKKHPIYGEQILKSITEYPYLSIGASGHHERYDGKGYPYGLKGTDIPEIARIISVADAYDAMSSKRSYREAIPQQMVREEIVKGTGTQFDPKYARLMLHLIDVDTEYEMSEREEIRETVGESAISVGRYRSRISEGMLLTPIMTTIRLSVKVLDPEKGKNPIPSMVMFDSLDGRVHEKEKEIKDLNYFEYGEIWFDGRTATSGARKMQTTVLKNSQQTVKKRNEYVIEAVKKRDHAMLRITSEQKTIQIIIALPDGARFVYLGLTGENCRIYDISTDKAQTEIEENYIPRIAEEISYIDGPVGDMPNVQIDGYRTDSSEGVEITEGLQISFHAKNLPTARLVWHCPFITIFCGDDGKVNGRNYRDLAFMRLDGEVWETDPNCSMVLGVTKNEKFGGWDAWKQFNHDGYESTATFHVDGNRITVVTENAGIAMKNTVILTDIETPVYAAITGDQVALTNIRVKRP